VHAYAVNDCISAAPKYEPLPNLRYPPACRSPRPGSTNACHQFYCTLRVLFSSLQHHITLPARGGSRILVWGPSRAGARIEAPQAPRVHGIVHVEGCLGLGGTMSLPRIFFGLEIRILVHSPAYLSSCFWTVISPVCLPSLTFQADCGSIKGAGVPACRREH